MSNISLARVESKRISLPQGAMLTLLLVVKLTLLRHFVYDSITVSGLFTDVISVLVLVSLFEMVLPRFGKGTIYWTFQVIFSILMFAATLYHIHFNTVPTFTAFDEMGQVPQIRGSIGPLVKFSHFLYFADIVVAGIFVAIRWLILRTFSQQQAWMDSSPPQRYAGWKWRTAAGLLMIGCISYSWFVIDKAESISNETVKSERIGYLNYQAATALKIIRENEIIANGNLDETKLKIQELQAAYPYRKENNPSGQPQGFGLARGANVIVVQLEAFQNFPIQAKLEGQEITPVLNKLVKESYYFPNIYQQIGQGNTSDAEFLSNTSIYPTGTVAMSTGFGKRVLPSMPRLLHDLNYQSATFHVNDVTFWNRHLLYPGLAFDHYYDKPYYKNDFFNDFGASDEELYRVGAEQIREMSKRNQPFYAQFVTTSSHAPFVVPDKLRKLTLPADMEGSYFGNYLTAINYTDYALGQFIEELKKQGIWDKTMLVVYGDHFGVNPKEASDKEITDRLGVPYSNEVSRFNIPLIIHVPKQAESKIIEGTGGQIDIMPTASNLLGISLQEKQFLALGRDMLNTDQNVVGMRYYLPTGSFFNNEVMFVPGEGFDDGTAISLKTLQPVPMKEAYRKDYDYILSFMKLSDEYVQLLPKR